MKSFVNPFVPKNPASAWVAPVSAMALVVGFMASLAWITDQNRKEAIRDLPPDQYQRLMVNDLDLAPELKKAELEIGKLREDNTKLQNLVAQNKDASTTLNTSLQDTKAFSGLTELEGPGVTITLSDTTGPVADQMDPAAGIIHDIDVLKVVNELWNAGAEAISVNNRRLGPTSNVRCVGTTILIDSVKIASPVVVRAIGDPQTLYGAMNLPEGVLDEIRSVDPKMVSIAIVEKHRLPAFAGSTSYQFAKVPKDTQ